MATVNVVLHELKCGKTTEDGHDELYYLAPAVTRGTGPNATADPPLPKGPTQAQHGNASGPGGEKNTAWDCNDSGPLADQTLDVPLFSLTVNSGEVVNVALNFQESDNSSLSDTITADLKAAETFLEAVQKVVGKGEAANVIADIEEVLKATGAVVSLVTSVFGSFGSNPDDPIGTVTFQLVGTATGAAQLVTAAAGKSNSVSVAGSNSAFVTAHLTGSGADYTVTLRLDGANVVSFGMPVAAARGPISVADLQSRVVRLAPGVPVGTKMQNGQIAGWSAISAR